MGVRSQQQKEEDGHSEGAASVDRVHSHCEELDASKWKNRKGGEKAIYSMTGPKLGLFSS